MNRDRRLTIVVGVFVSMILCGAGIEMVSANGPVCSVSGYGDLFGTCRSTPGPCSEANQPQVVQIGGPGARSSEENGDPGLLDLGEPAAAIIEYQVFPDSDSDGLLELNVTARNSDCVSALTAIFFNVGSNVNNHLDLRVSGASVPWSLDFIKAEDQGNPPQIKADGFGKFDAVIYNGENSSPQGGDPNEILAGQSLTFVMDIEPEGTGAVCDFINDVSLVNAPNPDVQKNVVGRFQSGAQGGSAFLGPCGPPLLVQLASLTASPADGRVLIEWETSSELANEGFNIIRKGVVRGGPGYINENLIPGRGDSLSGFRYTFTDSMAVNGVAYRYYLEDIDLSGVNSIHGPYVAIANPNNPRIQLKAPGYGAEIANASRLRFSFETGYRGRLMLQISDDPTFESHSLTINTGAGRREVSLRGSRAEQLRTMAAAAEGFVYWRVRVPGAPEDGSSDSQTFRLRLSDAAQPGE